MGRSLLLSAKASGTVASTVSFKYDAALRPIEENVASGAVTTSAAYVYDADGRLTGVGSETLAYRAVLILDDKGVNGFGVGVGPGVGLSYSATFTSTLTLQGVADWLTKGWCWN